MQFKTKTRLNAAAFTLTEVLVSVAVLGVATAALLLGFSQSFRMVDNNRENLRATQVLEEKMEMIRLYTWDQVTNGGYIPTSFTDQFDPTAPSTNAGSVYYGTVIITNAPITETYTNDLRYVNITVKWTNSGMAHVRDMTSFISHYGLQNYIY